MDQQFKKILQKTKAWNQGVEPLAHTFEGALFKDSAWPFAFDESIATEQVVPLLKKTPAAAVIVKPDVLSLVLFVGDTFKEGNDEDLLGKMIQAMRLKPSEFNRVLFNEKLDEVSDLAQNVIQPSIETSDLFEQILKYRPQVVVSLGATVTNILLGKREKLSSIHGQFFDKITTINNNSHAYQFLPIFHPEFLLINPNMKRTAWIDLQKVMERVGKI